jgi:hypothetical protein
MDHYHVELIFTGIFQKLAEEGTAGDIFNVGGFAVGTSSGIPKTDAKCQ